MYYAVRVPGHPMAASDGYAPEHRYILWELGILNESNRHCQVHHIDHDGLNNDPSNLEIVSHEEHRRRHALEDGVKNQYGHHKANIDECEVDGCSLDAKNIGMCSAHETRFRRYGDPLVVKRVNIHTVKPYVLID